MKILLFIIHYFILLTSGNECKDGFCYKKDEYLSKNRYLLYNVNNGEGFNLRRDVYIRVATMVSNLR
jgi:hypothetical protein